MSETASVLRQIQGWHAADWRELSTVWRELTVKSPAQPSFRSQPLSPQEAGWLFERLIIEAFRLAGATIHYPFQIPTTSGRFAREQQDGLIIFGWQGFLIESKFQAQPTDMDSIFRLHALVERRPIGSLGLFFSYAGFTEPALESSEYLKPMRVLLFDSIDLSWALAVPGPHRMEPLVWRKWALAVKAGSPSVPVSEYDDGSDAPSSTGFVVGPYDETKATDFHASGSRETTSRGDLPPGDATG